MNRQVIRRLAVLSLLSLLPSATVLAQSSRSASAYNQRAVTRYVKGDIDGAIADFDIALKYDPSYANAYSNRGNARYAKGDLDGAIADLDKAIVLNPRDAVAYNNRGNALQAKGETEGAIRSHHPNSPRVPKPTICKSNPPPIAGKRRPTLSIRFVCQGHRTRCRLA